MITPERHNNSTSHLTESRYAQMRLLFHAARTGAVIGIGVGIVNLF